MNILNMKIKMQEDVLDGWKQIEIYILDTILFLYMLLINSVCTNKVLTYILYYIFA